jgi:hypothetical protein
MADPGGHGADQHLMRARLSDADFFDQEGLAHLAQNGGLHDMSPEHLFGQSYRR